MICKPWIALFTEIYAQFNITIINHIVLHSRSCLASPTAPLCLLSIPLGIPLYQFLPGVYFGSHSVSLGLFDAKVRHSVGVCSWLLTVALPGGHAWAGVCLDLMDFCDGFFVELLL